MRVSIVLDCIDPEALVPFWEAALNHKRRWGNEDFTVLSSRDGAPVLILQRVPEAKTTKNRMHIDIHPGDIDAKRAELEELGASYVDTVHLAELNVRWYVMLDPAGNEFCIVEDP